MLINASSAKADAVNPLITCGEPADTVKPFKFSPITLYVATGNAVLELKFTPTALPEQIAVGV